jgi:hypothetical protein
VVSALACKAGHQRQSTYLEPWRSPALQVLTVMHARAEKPIEALQQGHVAVAHLHARQPVAINRNQSQSVAIRRNPSQSVAIRPNPSQSVAICPNPSQSVAIRPNPAWPQGQWPLRTGKRRKGPNGGR